jgi:hypothetical protein
LKRLAAISFLCLLLFNIAGYRLWFHYAERQATAQLVATVEQDQYDASELITLTVPLSLPYQTDWADWEKVRGEIEIDGTVYQYVQRKVSGGQMILQCLPNHKQQQLVSARDRFFELANSFSDDQKKEAPAHTVKLTKPSLTDFDDHQLSWRFSAEEQSPRQCFVFTAVALLHCVLPVHGQPPEWIG